MSERNLDAIRSGIEAFNRRDVAGMLETMQPAAEFVPLRGVLEGVTYQGEEGVKRFIAEMSEEWSEFRIDVKELRAVGDAVLVLGNFHARGRASGVELDGPAAWVCGMEDGKLRRMQAFTRPEEALESLGAAGDQ